MNILSFLPKPSPTAADEITLPTSAEGLPAITVTPELLAAVRAVDRLRDHRAHALIRRIEDLHAKLPRNVYQTTPSERRDLAAEIAAPNAALAEIEAALADAEQALNDMVIAAVAEAGRRAVEDADFIRQREHEATEAQRRQREAERQHAEERRGRVSFVSRDDARIQPARGGELMVHRRELAQLGWQPERGDHVAFEIATLGGHRYAQNIRRLMPNSTDPWEED